MQFWFIVICILFSSSAISQTNATDTAYFSNKRFALVRYSQDIVSANCINSTLYKIKSGSQWTKVQDANTPFFDTTRMTFEKRTYLMYFQRKYYPDNLFVYAVNEHYYCTPEQLPIQLTTSAVDLVFVVNDRYYNITLGLDSASEKAKSLLICETTPEFKGLSTYARVFADSVITHQANFRIGNDIDVLIDFRSPENGFIFTIQYFSKENEKIKTNVYMNGQHVIERIEEIHQASKTITESRFYNSSMIQSEKTFRINGAGDKQLLNTITYSETGEVMRSVE